jgi:secreted Zn-dependent insulinase-like peptidase
VTLVGYNHKLRSLLDAVVEKIASFKVKPDRFSVIKVILILPERSQLFTLFKYCYGFASASMPSIQMNHLSE